MNEIIAEANEQLSKLNLPLIRQVLFLKPTLTEKDHPGFDIIYLDSTGKQSSFSMNDSIHEYDI